MSCSLQKQLQNNHEQVKTLAGTFDWFAIKVFQQEFHMDIRIPVSVGELFDKITILEIKNERITSEERLVHVRKELSVLHECVTENKLDIPQDLYQELKTINLQLWDTEDLIREKEEHENFDSDFIKYACMDAQLNDKRFVVKRKINDFFNSGIKEQKSYKETTLARKVIAP